jgi:hypothetical protein
VSNTTTTTTKTVGPHSHWDPASNKTITIKATTWKRLQKYGTFGDSFDSILQRILDEKEGKETPQNGRPF